MKYLVFFIFVNIYIIILSDGSLPSSVTEIDYSGLNCTSQIQGLCVDFSVHTSTNYLCGRTEFNGKCGSSTMFGELTAFPLPRETAANGNLPRLRHSCKPLQTRPDFCTGPHSPDELILIGSLSPAHLLPVHGT